MLLGYRRLADDGPLPGERIFDPPCRIWHWTNAVLIIVLIGTGYLIGQPLPTTVGDPSLHYVMGYIRVGHLMAGQLMAAAFIYRILWSFGGNRYAWQLFLPAIWRHTWTEGFVLQAKWIACMLDRAPRYSGVNPLSNIMFFALFVLPTIMEILTGFAMLSEVSGHDSWQAAVFGWLVTLCGNTLTLHLIHSICMWILVLFSIAHIYVAVREDIMGRQTIVSTMLSGIRNYRL